MSVDRRGYRYGESGLGSETYPLVTRVNHANDANLVNLHSLK